MIMNSPFPQLSGRVLLIDDEKLLLEMGYQMLTELGCQVTACQRSHDALDLFKKEPDSFNLVLTDQSMPLMTGLDLARRIHAIRPDVPILFLSGYIDDIELVEAKEAGVRELLSKPIRIMELADALGRYLPKSDNPA